MSNLKHVLILAIICAALVGCISARSFVDPSVQKVAYEEIKKIPEPLRLKLSVEFQRKGEAYPKADSTLRDNAERILRATGLIIPTEDKATGNIRIVVNNFGDTGSAVAKGIGTGLTFGLVGSIVMDSYEMSITITANGKTVTRTAIKHALYTAIGNTSLPPGVEAIPPNTAFERVLEQMLLRALKDMQQAGELTSVRIPDRKPWSWVFAVLTRRWT